jgi:hypothetical protein
MKHLNALCASASLLLGASSAAASEASADLFVKGSIAPGAACNVVIGSTLKLPPIKRKDLNANPALPTTDLEEQRVPTGVHCAQPTRFAFVMREAGGQDMNSEYAFTMRVGDSEKSPGKLLLLFDTQSTKIDNGIQGYATGASSMDGLEQATWGPATSSRENLPITNGRYAVGFVKTADSTEAPAYITDLNVKLLVRPWIKPVNELDLSADIGFSSDLGLEISYF